MTGSEDLLKHILSNLERIQDKIDGQSEKIVTVQTTQEIFNKGAVERSTQMQSLAQRVSHIETKINRAAGALVILGALFTGAIQYVVSKIKGIS